MNPAQRYRDKAAKADRQAEDPYLRPDMRAEFRSLARTWRHAAEQADWLTRRHLFPKQ